MIISLKVDLWIVYLIIYLFLFFCESCLRLIFVKFVKSLIAISSMVLGILCFVIAVQTNNLFFFFKDKKASAENCLYIGVFIYFGICLRLVAAQINLYAKKFLLLFFLLRAWTGAGF